MISFPSKLPWLKVKKGSDSRRISISYHTLKQTAKEYADARLALKGPGGPFAGWIISGKTWESFDKDGQIIAPEENEQ